LEEPVLRTQRLTKYFAIKKGTVGKTSYIHAVDGVTLQVNKGETLAIVGESGSGKSTLGLMVLKLINPTSGEIYFNTIEISRMSDRKFKKLRRRMAIVFQDPSASLNPRMTIKQTLTRPLILHGIKNQAEIESRIADMLERVGLGREHSDRYPHELSGGQQQRVAIARAIILNPELVILDEPTSSLDVSVQAQILNLLFRLQKQFTLTYLFISHDLVMVRHVSDRIAVMYLGQIVELADTDELFDNTIHPYTAALLSAVPIPRLRTEEVERLIVSGEPPSPIDPPNGCRFRLRCPYAVEKCRTDEPELRVIRKNHIVACHRAGEIDVSSYTKELWKVIETVQSG
jgi:oligopeptide/dipeptide ABC transporter ATP-binding protein